MRMPSGSNLSYENILPEIIEGSRSFFEVIKHKVTNKTDVLKLTKAQPFGC